MIVQLEDARLKDAYDTRFPKARWNALVSKKRTRRRVLARFAHKGREMQKRSPVSSDALLDFFHLVHHALESGAASYG